MTHPSLRSYFSDEMEKEAVNVGQIASTLGGAARRFGGEILTHAKAPFQALNPRKLQAALKSFEHSPVTDAFSARKVTGQASQFAGRLGELRRRGLLANIRPHEYGGAGKVLQYAPGHLAIHGGQALYGAHRELTDKETETGRKKGLGERLGRAGMGAATGLITAGAANRAARAAGAGGLLSGAAGMAGGMVGERIGGSLAAGIGGTAGRAVDTAASIPGKVLKKPKKQLAMPPQYQQRQAVA